MRSQHNPKEKRKRHLDLVKKDAKSVKMMLQKGKNGSELSSDGSAKGHKPLYLTKRILERAARNAFREAAKSSMDRMGYVVVKQDEWIVRLYRDGRVERIEKLEKSNIPLFLD